jgi:hypothetical protein
MGHLDMYRYTSDEGVSLQVIGEFLWSSSYLVNSAKYVNPKILRLMAALVVGGEVESRRKGGRSGNRKRLCYAISPCCLTMGSGCA